MTGSNPLALGRIFTADDDCIARAAEKLRAGDIVAIPTETVYGLAADANNGDAVAAIYRTKGRPDFNPLIVHVIDLAQAQGLAEFSPLALQLAAAFWPGPMTLVLPIKHGAPIAAAVSAGLPTLALRSPAHPVMRAILSQSGLCLAAPSANRSGGISPTTATHVAQSLGDVATMIVDGGPCAAGLESTIIAVRPNGWQILRPGPLSAAEIIAVAGQPLADIGGNSIEAPGQLASHYAPQKSLRLNVLTADPDEYHIGFGEIAGDDNLSVNGDLAQTAAHLFAALHRADASDRPRIAVAPVPNHGIGDAINDRLRRAAA